MRHKFTHPPFSVVPPGLQDDTYPRPPLLVAVRRVGAEHLDTAGRPCPETLKDFDRGGLAGPVRPEQGQHLPVSGLKRHIVQDVGCAAPHAQAVDLEHDFLTRHHHLHLHFG